MARANVAAMPAQLLQMIQPAEMVSRLDMVRALDGVVDRFMSGGERVFMVPACVVVSGQSVSYGDGNWEGDE